MSDSEHFTEKDYDKILDDIVGESFEQHNRQFDSKEALKVELLGKDGEVPEGYHRMPGTGEIMRDEEMI